MERLTTRNSEGIGVLKHPYQCERCGDLQWSLPDLGNGSPTERLAEYEDIGLTPEQLREIDKLYAEKCKELAELEKKSFSGIEMVKIWANLQKLKEYQKLEKQGKLLKLPCAVGDTVYADSGVFGILEYEVDNIVIGKTITYQCFAHSEAVGDCPGECLDEIEPDVSDFGRTVFLTREAAEAALKEAKRRQGKSVPIAYDVDKVVERMESMQDITGWDLLTVQECLKIVKSGGIG